MVMAKDGEVAHSFQPLMGVSRSFFWGLMEAKWPIRRSRPCIQLTLKRKREGGPKFGGPFNYIGAQLGLPDENHTVEQMLSGHILNENQAVLAPVWSNTLPGRHPVHLGFSYLDRNALMGQVFERLEKQLPGYFEPLGQSDLSHIIHPGSLKRSIRTSSQLPDFSEFVHLVNEIAEASRNELPESYQDISNLLKRIGVQARQRTKVIRFQVTQKSLENWKKEHLDPNIQSLLENLTRQKPLLKQDFLDILVDLIGEEKTARYESLILQHTEIIDSSKSIAAAYQKVLSSSYLSLPTIAVISHDTSVREALARCVEALLGDQARIVRLAAPAEAFGPGTARGKKARKLLSERQLLWQETVDQACQQGVTHAFIHTQEWFKDPENPKRKSLHDMPANKPAAEIAFKSKQIQTQFIAIDPEQNNKYSEFIGKTCNGLGDLLFAQSGIVDWNVLLSAANQFEKPPRIIAGITLVTQNAKASLRYGNARYLSVISHDLDQNETLARAYCIEDKDGNHSLLPFRTALFRTSQLSDVTLGRNFDEQISNLKTYLPLILRKIAQRDPNALIYINATNLNQAWTELRDSDLSRDQPLALPNNTLIKSDSELAQLRLVRVRPDHALRAFFLKGDMTSGRSRQAIIRLGESGQRTYLILKSKPDTMQQPATARTIGMESSELLRGNFPLSRALEILPAHGFDGDKEAESLCQATLLLIRDWVHFGGQTHLPSVLHLKKKFQEYAVVHAIDHIEEEMDDDEEIL